MTKTTYTSVDEYIASQPDRTRGILERVRATIRKAIPGAEETLSYQIPTYKIGGTAAIYFAGWKEHFSIYPATQTLMTDLGDDLAPYKISKGTIRFELSDAVPVKLITRIAKHRMAEVRATVTANSEKPTTMRAKTTAVKRGAR